jgi:membrane protein insertase Oxa1/YidC/SpoIIIJ
VSCHVYPIEKIHNIKKQKGQIIFKFTQVVSNPYKIYSIIIIIVIIVIRCFIYQSHQNSRRNDSDMRDVFVGYFQNKK